MDQVSSQRCSCIKSHINILFSILESAYPPLRTQADSSPVMFGRRGQQLGSPTPMTSSVPTSQHYSTQQSMFAPSFSSLRPALHSPPNSLPQYALGSLLKEQQLNIFPPTHQTTFPETSPIGTSQYAVPSFPQDTGPSSGNVNTQKAQTNHFYGGYSTYQESESMAESNEESEDTDENKMEMDKINARAKQLSTSQEHLSFHQYNTLATSSPSSYASNPPTIQGHHPNSYHSHSISRPPVHSNNYSHSEVVPETYFQINCFFRF